MITYIPLLWIAMLGIGYLPWQISLNIIAFIFAEASFEYINKPSKKNSDYEFYKIRQTIRITLYALILSLIMSSKYAPDGKPISSYFCKDTFISCPSHK